MKKIAVLSIILFAGVHLFAQNNYPFRVAVSGSGKQAILFIPGFASSGDVWNATVDNYKKDYTCYVLTMAGFAGVPAQPDASFTNWEKSIADYIQQQHINQPIIIGHSMGGGLALALAADYPKLVSRIVVVDALPCLAALMNPAFKPTENLDCSATVSRFTAMNDSQFCQMQKMSMPRLLADTAHLQQVVNWSVQSDRATFAQMYCDFSNTDLRNKIAGIQCPALILLESYFANLKPDIEMQYKNLKTAQLQYATKGLHFIMYDDADWYNSQLSNFINP